MYLLGWQESPSFYLESKIQMVGYHREASTGSCNKTWKVEDCGETFVTGRPCNTKRKTLFVSRVEHMGQDRSMECWRGWYSYKIWKSGTLEPIKGQPHEHTTINVQSSTYNHQSYNDLWGTFHGYLPRILQGVEKTNREDFSRSRRESTSHHPVWILSGKAVKEARDLTPTVALLTLVYHY